MLLTNQRVEKLMAARAQFVADGLLSITHDLPPQPVLRKEEGEDSVDDPDIDPLEEPTDEYVDGNVVLARTRGMYFVWFFKQNSWPIHDTI